MFDTPWKTLKTFGFLMVSGGIKINANSQKWTSPIITAIWKLNIMWLKIEIIHLVRTQKFPKNWNFLALDTCTVRIIG